jgi:hypothetical protein
MSIRILGEPESGAAGILDQPAGILVLDSWPQPPDPQLRAFVWCRCHPNQPALPAEPAAVAEHPSLMVGLFANGHPSGNGHK